MDLSLHGNIGDFSLSEEQLNTFTGLNCENIIKLRQMFTSMQNRKSQTVTQAPVSFLFKFRSGSTNKMIQQILGLEYEQNKQLRNKWLRC